MNETGREASYRSVSIAEGLSAPTPPESTELSVWLPVILWAVAIFVFSTSYFSAANTGRFIEPILRWLLPSATAATIDVLHWFVRKSAHFTEYLILFWLLIRGPLSGRPYAALAACAAYAFLDEGHQMFVIGRTPSLYDVGLDFSGALFSRFLHMATVEVG